MLIYNHGFDIYHTIFRILQIMEKNDSVIEIDKLRILDFYLAFPSELLEIKSFRGFKKYESFIKQEQNSYERILNRKRLFFKMENIQLSAIKSLIAFDILETEDFINGKVKRTAKQLYPNLQERIEKANNKNPNLITLITGPLASINLYGHLGLKERTNLLEFKYDTI